MNKIIIKYTISFCFAILYGGSIFAQVKQPSQSTSEIDKLCNKYKNSETITLFTPYGDLLGNVGINYNDAKKPISVNISGESSNVDAVTEFLISTIKMKMKQGYKLPSGNSLSQFIEDNTIDKNTFWENISFSPDIYTKGRKLLLKKGTMFFKVNTTNIKKTIRNLDTFEELGDRNECTWEIETGDLKRKGGNSSSTFEF